MKWIVDQAELKSRIKEALEVHGDLSSFAKALSREIYNDAKQVMLLPDEGIMNTEKIVSAISALPGNAFKEGRIDLLATALEPAIQAAVDAIGDAARESNLFLVGLLREGGKYYFLAKSGHGEKGITDDPKESAVFSRSSALSMALADERYSALPISAVTLITGISARNIPESGPSATSQNVNTEEPSADYIKGHSQAIEKVLKLFDSEIGFCHDPMGQEAINMLQDAIKRLEKTTPTTNHPRSPGL